MFVVTFPHWHTSRDGFTTGWEQGQTKIHTGVDFSCLRHTPWAIISSVNSLDTLLRTCLLDPLLSMLNGIDSTIYLWFNFRDVQPTLTLNAGFESLVPPHPKGALLNWDLVTMEVIWVKWSHVHKTSLRLSEFCVVFCICGPSASRFDVPCVQRCSSFVAGTLL